jgi:hypothetical protein
MQSEEGRTERGGCCKSGLNGKKAWPAGQQEGNMEGTLGVVPAERWWIFKLLYSLVILEDQTED